MNKPKRRQKGAGFFAGLAFSQYPWPTAPRIWPPACNNADALEICAAGVRFLPAAASLHGSSLKCVQRPESDLEKKKTVA